ncbi:MAG: DsrE family protein [Deltaproteobacteria bacterium]|jgi:predicted peroxiredoxin|nr:DsrE family protein [Deltaproteobacteria bacterium]
MSKKYMMIITHSIDTPHRTCTAIGLASCLMVEGADVALFFMCDGALLMQKGIAETIEGQNIAPVRDLMPIILERDPQLYVCKIDLKNLGIPEDDLLEGVKIVTLPTVAEFMMDRETLMC